MQSSIRKAKTERLIEAQAVAEEVAARHHIKDPDIMERLLIPLAMMSPGYFEADERGVLTQAARVRQESAAWRCEATWGDLQKAIARHWALLGGKTRI